VSFDGNFNYIVCRALKYGTYIQEYTRYMTEAYSRYTVGRISYVKHMITVPPSIKPPFTRAHPTRLDRDTSITTTRQLFCHNLFHCCAHTIENISHCW